MFGPAGTVKWSFANQAATAEVAFDTSVAAERAPRVVGRDLQLRTAPDVAAAVADRLFGGRDLVICRHVKSFSVSQLEKFEERAVD